MKRSPFPLDDSLPVSGGCFSGLVSVANSGGAVPPIGDKREADPDIVRFAYIVRK